MSAIAAIITPEKTFLYSDGFGIDQRNGYTLDDYKKIDKINDRVVFLSVGRWYTEVRKNIVQEVNESDLTEPKDIAEKAAGMMKEQLEDVDYYSESQPDNQASSHLLVFGYVNGKPVFYHIDSSKAFVPQQIYIHTIPFVIAMVYGNFGGNNPYTPHLWRCRADYSDLEKAGYEAFSRMIDDYKDTGRVSENIFTEVIGAN